MYFSKTEETNKNIKEQIKKYVKEVLEDEQEHSTKGITEYVDLKLKENGIYIFQIPSYIYHAMKDLISTGNYARIARGVYQKGGVPYIIPRKYKSENTIPKLNFKDTMISIKKYARKYKQIFTAKPPFEDMDSDETRAYQEIKKFLLDKAQCLENSADKILSVVYAENENGRDGKIRKYFKEYLSDGNPHRMNDIRDYIFSKMIENGEYNGERSTAYIYTAIRSLIENDGKYEKVLRGIYKLRKDDTEIFVKSKYSMADIGEQLNIGCSFLNGSVKYLLTNDLRARGIEDDTIINQLCDDLESSIDGVSFLLAFVDDYMDSRQKLEQDGIQGMSGM